MIRFRTVLVAAGMTGMLLLGVTGCGDDDDGSSAAVEDGDGNDVNELEEMLEDGALSDAIDDSGVDRECLELALRVQEAFGSTAAGINSPERLGDAADAFEDLADDLPAVADELATISAALRSAQGGDFDAFGSDEYAEAQTAVSDHFSETCPGE